MLTTIGIGLVAAGVVVALFGDRVVSEDHGFVSKLVAWPAGRAKLLRVVIGLALIYAGIMVLAN